MSSILVQIAAYRDLQLIPTIKNLLSMAMYPENLKIVVAWQHDDTESIEELMSLENITILEIPYTLTKGVGWARNLLQQQYDGEDYVLQLDGHHRFVKNWDMQCIDIIKKLQSSGYIKPLLTAYLPGYDETSGNILENYPSEMYISRFEELGYPLFSHSTISGYKDLILPIKTPFFSGHFVFTIGDWDLEVPYDPECWDILVEEINMAIRSYTHGYDLFHPHKVLAYHCYNRTSRWIHLRDDKDFFEKRKLCASRLRKLLDNDIDLGLYGLGSNRSLSDYETLANVSFKNKLA
jgi:hypothetical protein